MKTKLMIVSMVLISLGGLAQKPVESPEYLKYKEIKLRVENRVSKFQENKRGSFVHKHEAKEQVRRNEYRKSNNLKAELALPTQQMDSIVDVRWNNQLLKWEVSYREWMEYDSLGNNISDTYLGADGLTFPDYGGKWEAVFDENSRIKQDMEYDWIFGTNDFQVYQRGTYEYDANGHIALIQSDLWDDIGQTWYTEFVDSISTDGTGMILEHKAYSYDTILMIWEPSFWTVSEIDSTGVRIRQSQYYWDFDSVDWALSYYTDFQVDAMGRDTSAIDYYWNGSWYEESQKRTNKYDGMDNLIQEATWYWDGESQFVGNQKYDYTYNAAGAMLEEIYWQFDFFWFKWNIYEKTTYAHDGNGNLIEEARFYYDTASMSYGPDWKDIYEYDLTTAWSDIAIPHEIKEETEGSNRFPIINKVTGFTELVYDTILMVWDTAEVEFLKYSPFGSVAAGACKADFNFTPDQDPQTIIFRDASASGVSSWYWTFGDGTTSTMSNPRHTYAFPGTYKVSLSTIDGTGQCTNTMVKQIAIGNTICNAEFMMIVDTVKMTIMLDNVSQGANLNYFWNFGDGEVSNLMNPTHTYNYPGSFNVSLTIQNDAGTCIDRFNLNTRVGTAICQADFDVFVDSSTYTATFRSKNQNPDNIYRWEFGDGSIEKKPNVVKTFTHPGYYTATLKVANLQANCVNSRKETVLVGRKNPGGKAGFIYLSGNGNKVQFSDRSLGEKLNYFWNFNDESTSTEQNPMHEFALPGYYNVCLTVFTSDGNRDTYCEKIFAGTNTKDQCVAQFEYRLSESQLQIMCLDRSLGNPDKWKWTYDDGWSTTAKNPSWSTSKPSYVKLQQTIYNSTTGCRDDAFALINMGEVGKLKAGFGYIVDTLITKAETYPVDFIGVSLGDAGKLKWSFGDGTFDSTSINPIHVYEEPGTYLVCLTLINGTTGEESVSCEWVPVGVAASSEDKSYSTVGLKSYPNPFRESTKIEINLAESSDINLSVYDLMGRKVRTIASDHRSAGIHILNLEATDLDAGNYYLILETNFGINRSVLSIVR